MTDYSVLGNKVDKFFGRRLIFRNLEFDFTKPGVYGIAGANGSGKSTLVKMIAGITSPSAGSIIHRSNGKDIIPEKLHDYIGFVSPYLVLYDEFSAAENLHHTARIRGIKADEKKIDTLLGLFLLSGRKNDLVKTYSSGMKQRLKFIFALIHSPKLIILDEPTSNLDSEGKEKVYTLIKQEGESNIVIIASNEETDLALCSRIISIEKYKN
jgi:heme exporter protein A